MEKNSYETYEFLTTTMPTNADTETNQFFVLQDDGTILTVNKEIQYVTQIENKETIGEVHPAAIFDVSSQQYFVDVDNNASELISINDQFAIANRDKNVYTNSLLIQAESSTSTQQIETESVIDPQKIDVPQLQQPNVDGFNETKQNNDFTEVTLSDDQYQILEQKGWILLDCNDKIFVLNTLGLHDITTDDKLIQRLKSELQGNSEDIETGTEQTKLENVTSLLPNENNHESAQQNNIEFVVTSGPQNTEPVEYIQFSNKTVEDISNAEREQKPTDTNEGQIFEVPTKTNSLLYKEIVQATNGMQQKCDSIKIKTKYTFTDIPDKIFLGKTVNGKKLFAKVTKKSTKQIKKVKYGRKIEKRPNFNVGLDEIQFINVIQDLFRDESKAKAESIACAGAVVSQLLRLPNIKDSVVGSNIIVTKVVTCINEKSKVIGQPMMVTGTVKMVNGEESFVDIPQMLQKLLDKSDDKAETVPVSESKEEKTAKDVIDLHHVHISETKYIDRSPQTSINISKRKLALDVLKDAKKRHPNPIYACGSCGATFKSQSSFKEHQDGQCQEAEDELTIDTEDLIKNNDTLYSVLENGKEKWYSCMICEAKFARLFNCQKHLRTHKSNEKKLKVYRCKMCPSTYFHSSSLSKHIVKMHIQVQSN